MRTLLCLFAIVVSGCLTHVPPNALAERRFLEIDWAPGFTEARARAVAESRPVLVMLVSGELDGLC